MSTLLWWLLAPCTTHRQQHAPLVLHAAQAPHHLGPLCAVVGALQLAQQGPQRGLHLSQLAVVIPAQDGGGWGAQESNTHCTRLRGIAPPPLPCPKTKSERRQGAGER